MQRIRISVIPRAQNTSFLKRAFGHRLDILQNEQFMSKYYDNSPVPKESELDTTEFRTRLESWYECGWRFHT